MNMDCKYSGSSKQRRDLLKAETELLGDELPFEFGKLSQLRILKAACAYLKKEKHFAFFKNNPSLAKISYLSDGFFDFHETIRNDGLLGFVICFTRNGELVYMSESITDYLGFNSIDLLLNYDYIYELAHNCDKKFYDDLKDNFSNYIDGNKFSFFSLLFASKVKRKQTSLSEYKLFKITGSYDIITQMYIATCVPVLSVSNRELLSTCNAECFTSIHKLDLKFFQLDSLTESLLGYNYNMDNLSEKSLYNLISADCLKIISDRHRQVLNNKNTKGYLDPIQLLHKDGYYVSCLLNMYYDSTGLLVCKYQIMKPSDVMKYNEYVNSFKRDWFSNQTSSRVQDDLDESFIEESSPQENTSLSSLNSAYKRGYDDDLANLTNETNSFDLSKRVKREDMGEFFYEQEPLINDCINGLDATVVTVTSEATIEILSPPLSLPSQQPIIHSALCRKSSADVKINIIKEEILNEIEYLRSSTSTSPYSTSQLNSSYIQQLEDIPEEDYFYAGVTNNSNNQYDQLAPESQYQEVYQDSNDFMMYDTIYENIYSECKLAADYDVTCHKNLVDDEISNDDPSHFDFSESVWLESLEELF